MISYDLVFAFVILRMCFKIDHSNGKRENIQIIVENFA